MRGPNWEDEAFAVTQHAHEALERVGPYQAQMLWTAEDSLILRTSLDQKWSTGLYWERATHLSDHHPADCLHAIVNIGGVAPHSQRVSRGKIYWLPGSGETLVDIGARIFPARSNAPSACPTVHNGYGIAMNHPDIGGWREKPAKFSSVKHPTDTVPYADSGLIANPSEKNPDLWIETKDMATLYYRTPANTGYYNDDPQRPIGRHNQRGNAGFVDGHAQPSE